MDQLTNKELALQLISNGYAVIPCYPRGHEKAKAPMVTHGQKDASSVEGVILRWFGSPHVEKLIGIPCKDNGFFAVDVDGPEGEATWSAWTNEYKLPEPGPMQLTTHGAHYLFKHPNFDFPGSVGKLGAGIDLRSNNYICTGGTGSGYEWIVPITQELPEAPAWLLDKIKALITPPRALPELTELAATPPDNPDAVAGYWFDKYTREARQGTRDTSAYHMGLQLYRSHIPIGTALNLGPRFIQSIPQPSGSPYTQAEYSRAIRSAYSTAPREPATLPREVRQAEKPEPKAAEKGTAVPEPKQAEKPTPKAAAEAPPEAKKAPKNEGKAETGRKTTAAPETAPETPAGFSTWADLDAVLGPIEWEWPGWLAKGFLHILVGMTGEGKSRLALRICGTYLTGLEWPDGTPYKSAPACVLWGEAEAGQAMNRDRAKFMDLPTDKIFSPLGDPLGDFRLNSPEHLAKLAYMATLPEVKLIVIDSLSGADPTAEKSTEDAKNVNWLAALARDVQKPIILTHHLRKRGLFDDAGEVSLDRVRGISTILQYARVIWAIDTPNLEDKETKRLSVIKSNLAKKPEPIGFVINDHIEFVEAPRKPKVETIQDKAVDLMLALLARGPISAAQAEKEFTGAGMSRRAMFDAKKALAVVSVRRGDGWVWSLPAMESDVDD